MNCLILNDISSQSVCRFPQDKWNVVTRSVDIGETQWRTGEWFGGAIPRGPEPIVTQGAPNA